MKKLALCDTDSFDELAWPDDISSQVTQDASALEVFTDFKLFKPLVIDSSSSAIKAEKLMQKTKERLKFVVDKDCHFLGIISLEELNDQEVIKKLSDGYTREELSISDFMKPRVQLKALSYSELKKASIGDVIQVLKSSCQQHCLVVDRGQHEIRGVISANEIAKKLKFPINIAKTSQFVGVFKLNH